MLHAARSFFIFSYAGRSSAPHPAEPNLPRREQSFTHSGAPQQFLDSLFPLASFRGLMHGKTLPILAALLTAAPVVQAVDQNNNQ